MKTKKKPVARKNSKQLRGGGLSGWLRRHTLALPLMIMLVFGAIGVYLLLVTRAASGPVTSLDFIKTTATGSGSAEVHTLSSNSNYQLFSNHAASGLGAGDGPNGKFQMVGRDLVFIKTKNTGGMVEVHTLTGASGYKTFSVHAASAVSAADAPNGTFAMVGQDMAFIKTKNTGAGTIEVHIVTAASGYKTFSIHSTTALSAADAGNGIFTMVGRDLAFIKTKNTGSGKVEVHILTAASGYKKFSVHAASVFSAGDVPNGWFSIQDSNQDGSPDLAFIKTANTASGTIELFYAYGPSYTALSYATPTAFAPGDAQNGTWLIGGQTTTAAITTSSTDSTSSVERAGFSVWNRDQVNNAYKSLWASGAGARAYWNGNASSCTPGNISNEARAAQINAINFARLVNGLKYITGAYSQSADRNLNAQKTAVLMEANSKISHYPTSSWSCYNATAADLAGKSNLQLVSMGELLPLSAVKSYFDEPGPNYEVGHRRWLLSPDAVGFGFGMTTRASAIQVIGLKTDANNSDPAHTSWPSRGHFPAPLAPVVDNSDRWSYSVKEGVNLAYANVSVTKDGVGIPVTKRGVVNKGYPRSTLVWEMPKNSNTGNYYVTITGARKDGKTLDKYVYPVYFFTPY